MITLMTANPLPKFFSFLSHGSHSRRLTYRDHAGFGRVDIRLHDRGWQNRACLHSAMFSKHNELVLPDLSTDLSDDNDWKVGALRTLEFPVNVTAIAVEPIASLLAAGG